MKTAVIAIGGNAILRPGEEGTSDNQRKRIRETVEHFVDLIEEGYEIVITHGNGPQVGAIVLQNEMGKDVVPAMPLDVCVAKSQGQIGYLIQQAFNEQMKRRGIDHVAISLVTQNMVDVNDPAFSNPTKFIGPYYKEEEVEELQKKGWAMKADPRGGYRRVVASPEPMGIVEKEAIRRLIFGQDKYVVIAGGGGGIPVAEKDGRMIGVEAVIDKDLASSVLASSIGESLFVILTDVEQVSLDYGTPEARPLGEVTLDFIKEKYKEGQFPPGSMGPKIEAAIRFLENGGMWVLITSPENVLSSIHGKGGTWIMHDL